MQTDKYLGIDQLYLSEYKASASKFYGFLFPVADVDDFEEKIKSYKMDYGDANHVCSACVIGLQREYQRCSDDGEPSNSSGRPILNTLLSAEITNVGCAVVRYFGGKKLGIPGLIESYGSAAQLCIEKAKIKELTVMSSTSCRIDASTSYLLYNFLSKHPEVSYDTAPDGIFILTHPKSLTTELHKQLLNIDTLAIIK